MSPVQFAEKLSAQDLADVFGVSHSTIHRWVNERGLPHQRTIGKRLRFNPELVRDYLERRGLDVPAELVKLTEKGRGKYARNHQAPTKAKAV